MRPLRMIALHLLRLAFAMCVVSGIAIAAPIQAADVKSPAATTTWDPALQVPGDKQAWFPDVAIDPAGTIHMIWNTSEETAPTTQGETTSQEPTVRDYLMYGQFGSPNLAKPTDIGLAHGGEAIRNALLLDRDGSVDVLYRSSEHIWFTKAPVSSAPRASAWSEPRRLSGNGTAYYAAIAQDASGTLHVLYSENAPVDVPQAAAPIRRESLFYRRSSDGGATWSSAVRISSTTSLHGTTRPQIRISGTTIVVAWDEGYDNINAKSDPAIGGIRRSLDGGQTWQPIQVIAEPDIPIEQVTFAFGKENRSLLVWREVGKDIVRFATSDTAGASWSSPLTVPNITARPYLLKHQFDRYALTADSTGVFHLLAVGQVGSPDQLALLHLELRDGTWSAPQSVYSGQGLPEYPGIATDGGNHITVSFFVRDNLFEIGNYRVWRVNGVMAAPAVEPRPVPTVAAVSASRPRATAPAIAIARSTFVPGVIEPEQRARIDHPPGVVSFGLGVVAAAGLVGAVVATRLWWVSRS